MRPGASISIDPATGIDIGLYSVPAGTRAFLSDS